MAPSSADVVICGAGIAGVAAAYHLAVRRGVRGVVLVDERPPLTLTSDKSAECYRNWWPGPGDAMVALMNRSIDLLEELARESGNVFRMNRRGYLFATAEPGRVPQFRRAPRRRRPSAPARAHARDGGERLPAGAADGFESPLTGADVITDPSLIRRHFPYLAPDTVALLHARRCGWFSGQQLGMYLLERAREHGVRARRGTRGGDRHAGGRVRGVRCAGRAAAARSGRTAPSSRPGPSVHRRRPPARRRPADLLRAPREDRLQRRARCHAAGRAHDDLGRSGDASPGRTTSAPSSAARRRIGASSRSCPRACTAGPRARARARPSSASGPTTSSRSEPTFPLGVRSRPTRRSCCAGMARMIPALAPYLDRLPRCFVDGGYYTKTRENRFLAGPPARRGRLRHRRALRLRHDVVERRRRSARRLHRRAPAARATRPRSASTATTTPPTRSCSTTGATPASSDAACNAPRIHWRDERAHATRRPFRAFYGWWIVGAGFSVEALIGALMFHSYGAYVVHEMLHLTAPTHSEQFLTLMRRYYPSWRRPGQN